jgi:hypothetical protein
MSVGSLATPSASNLAGKRRCGGDVTVVASEENHARTVGRSVGSLTTPPARVEPFGRGRTV